MHAGRTDLHPDFGPPAYGMAYDVFDASQPRISVDFRYASESDDGQHPFDGGTPIEAAVDTRGCRVAKGSARFAYGSRCPGPS